MRPSHTALTLAVVAAAGLVGPAHADDQVSKKPPPAAAKPVADVKPVAPRPPPPAAPPVAAMPTASAEIAAHAKAMKRTWRCKGTMFLPDGTSIPSDGTLTMKLALDKFWAQTSYVGKGKHAYKFESFRTRDAVSGKWQSVMIDNVGGHQLGTSSGPEGAKLVWLAESRGPMGSHKSRHTEELVGANLKLWGETSMDGKSWIKAYESACK